MRTHINTKPDETLTCPPDWAMQIWNLSKRAELSDNFAHPELSLLERAYDAKRWNLVQHVSRKQYIKVAITDLDTCKIIAEFCDHDGATRQLTPGEERAVERLEEFVRAIVHEYGNDGYLEQLNASLVREAQEAL